METTALQPKAVFDCFAQVNRIPRPSKREEKMIEFLKSFGERLGLPTKVDEAGNVLITIWTWFAKRMQIRRSTL